MFTEGSWLSLPLLSASEGASVDLSGVGARRLEGVGAFKSSVDLPLCAKGEERLASSGNVVTLLMGLGPNLGEPWLPSKVFDEEPSGEFDSAIDDGRD